jgi:hypothetical protein
MLVIVDEVIEFYENHSLRSKTDMAKRWKAELFVHHSRPEGIREMNKGLLKLVLGVS